MHLLPLLLASAPLSTEGWLYLIRPLLAGLTVLFVAAAWRVHRAEASEREAGPASAVLAKIPSVDAPVTPAPVWTIEVVGLPGLSSLGGRPLEIAGRVTVGRSPDCAVILNDPLASALHVVLHVDGGDCVVEDMGSRNGTTVDGRPVSGRVTLRPDSSVQIGDVTLRVRASSGAVVR